ncbi:NAD-dependent epimerase/dehydratase family protein [Vreelandella sp. EE7]
MTTCLVTGGSGFTGRYLIAHLKQQGHTVVALASHPCGADETHRIDLNDEANVQNIVQETAPDQVYHLAALSFVGHPRPLDFYRVNVLGTETLLRALCQLTTPPRVLLASSANVYGANGQVTIDESVIPLPVNHYAHSKLAMEHMALTYKEQLPLLLARPFNYTGPGQASHFLVPKIVEHIKRREKTMELGNTHVSRDFSDVRDIVAIYAQLLAAWPPEADSASVINIGSGEATSLTTLVRKLESLAKHSIEINVNPAFIRANEIPELKACTKRLKAWAPDIERIPIEHTLADMLKSD